MYTLTAGQIESLASLAKAVAKPADPMTPILQNLHLSRDGDQLVAIATDRYIAAEVRFNLDVADWDQGPEEILLGADSAIRALALTKASRMPAAHFTITRVEGDGFHTIEVRDLYEPTIIADREVTGNFPPVARLFPGPDVEMGATPRTALNLSFLARVGQILLPGERTAGLKSVAWTMASSPVENAAKPGPVLFTRGGAGSGSGSSARVLVQPNTLVK